MCVTELLQLSWAPSGWADIVMHALGLEHFSLLPLKTLYKGKELQREEERMAQSQRNSQKPNDINSWSVICHFREHLKMFGLVCVLFSIKADVEHDRWNFLWLGDGRVLPPTQNTYQENKDHWPLVDVVNVFPWLFSKPAPVRNKTNKKTICKGRFTSFRLQYEGHYREEFLYSLHCLIYLNNQQVIEFSAAHHLLLAQIWAPFPLPLKYFCSLYGFGYCLCKYLQEIWEPAIRRIEEMSEKGIK